MARDCQGEQGAACVIIKSEQLAHTLLILYGKRDRSCSIGSGDQSAIFQLTPSVSTMPVGISGDNN